MTAHVIKGRLELDEPVDLPEGMAFSVEPLEPVDLGTLFPHHKEGDEIPTLYERYKDFIGILDGLPSDLAHNHDHYIHGTPKK